MNEVWTWADWCPDWKGFPDEPGERQGAGREEGRDVMGPTDSVPPPVSPGKLAYTLNLL